MEGFSLHNVSPPLFIVFSSHWVPSGETASGVVEGAGVVATLLTAASKLDFADAKRFDSSATLEISAIMAAYDKAISTSEGPCTCPSIAEGGLS